MSWVIRWSRAGANQLAARRWPSRTALWTGLDDGNVTVPATPYEKQKRYRERRKAEDQASPDVIERELLQEVGRELSDPERIALAEKLADLARDFLWRSHRLSKMAHKLRTGSDHPL